MRLFHKTSVPEVWHRQRAKIWFTSRDPGYSSSKIKHEELVEFGDPSANLILSQIEGTEFHAPVIDLDFPCELWPSATEGHFHLLLNKPITWEQYAKLLMAFLEAGLVEEEWVNAAIKSKKSAIRDAGVLKYEVELYRKNLTDIEEALR